jgi:hypothetical protein
MHRLAPIIIAIALLCSFSATTLQAQEDDIDTTMEIYGQVQTDAGYDFNRISPLWYDVLRPTKLPANKNEFGTDGNAYFSVRQTTLGINSYFETILGQLETNFEFDMFGTGINAGSTTFRLNLAYGEIGHFGAGQYYSPFMDLDVSPNELEYWGPCGMVFYRNVQVRYMPIKGDSRMTIALEMPGGSSDQGSYINRIELQDVNTRFAYPDLSAEYRRAAKWGYVELAGILRGIQWQDQGIDSLFDFSGGAIGWGLNLSTNLNLDKKTVFKGQLAYGAGVENYMNDAPVDIGVQNNFSNHRAPLKGVALPVLGIVAFFGHTWSGKLTSSIGYSLVNIENSDAQAAFAFKRGQYAIANLLYSPNDNTTMGIEYEWGYRTNFRDGWSTPISKIQISFRFSFDHYFYHKQPG